MVESRKNLGTSTREREAAADEKANEQAKTQILRAQAAIKKDPLIVLVEVRALSHQREGDYSVVPMYVLSKHPIAIFNDNRVQHVKCLFVLIQAVSYSSNNILNIAHSIFMSQ